MPSRFPVFSVCDGRPAAAGLLAVLLLGGLLAAAPAHAQQAHAQSSPAEDNERPNIVWIIGDDVSPYLGAYGDTLARTPHLDRLAAEGMRYTNAFAVSGVCSPNRSALVTGLYPTGYGAMHHRTGNRKPPAIPGYEAVPPPEAQIVTEYLRADGYYAVNNGKEDYQFSTPVTAWDASIGTWGPYDEEPFPQIFERANWRDRPGPEQPFFAVFNLLDSHESRIWMNDDRPLQTDPAAVEVPPYYPDPPAVREDLARNYDNIALMDRKVGMILDSLRADGLMDETVVLFFGDHGSGLPRMKRSLYDSGIRVPLIARVPAAYRDAMGAAAPGTATGRIVSFVDFAPTLLSMAGLDVPDYMPGRAFLGAQQGSERDYAFAARDRMDEQERHTRRAVTDGRFKYIRNYRPDSTHFQHLAYRKNTDLMPALRRLHRAGRLDSTQAFYFRDTMPKQELYDTRSDPHEVNNLAGDPRYTDTLVELRRAEQRWRARTDDLGLIPEPVLKNILWPPRGNQPTVAAPPFDVQERKEGAAPTVRIESATRGTSIGYRMNASGPWHVYTAPVRVAPGDTLRAQAVRMGYEDSKTARRPAPNP
jgi:arylsulfatase A-like enzyme